MAAATLKRSASSSSFGDTFVDGKRRAITDLSQVPISSTAGSWSGDVRSTFQKHRASSPLLAEAEPTASGRPSSGNSPVARVASKEEAAAAEARFRAAPSPPASCVCVGGSKKVVADDVYGQHFRCGECFGMTTASVSA
jgi:hypothetical protein